MNFLRKYNDAATIIFPLYDPTGATLTTGATFAAGDVKIIKDEGAAANTTNLPAHEGNGLYSLVLTATEMQARRIGILIDDQTATELWLGVGITIDSYGNSSAGIVFDLSQDTPAVNTTKWNGTAVATPTVAGVPEVDVTHSAGAVLGSAASGYIPADARRVDGQTLSSHSTGNFPADVLDLEGSGIGTHLTGMFPADVLAVNGNSAIPVRLESVLANSETLTVTTSTSNTTFSATGAAATTDDNYIDRVGIFKIDTTTTALRGRPFYVTDYTGSTKTFTVDQLNAVPAVGDSFILLP